MEEVKKALVIEGDDMMQKLIKDFLELIYPGCAVDVTSDEVRAIEMISHCGYDLITTDFLMLAIDGIGIFDQVRKKCRSQVLIITGREDMLLEAAEKRPEKNFVEKIRKHSLGKPFSLESFKVKVKEVMAAKD